jgi:putative Holliday junction resolvase
MPAADPAIPLEALAAALSPGATLMGLDLGTRTIGLAIADPTLSIASALQTILRTRFKTDAAELLALAQANKAGGLVVGLPLNMDGSEGPRAQSTRAFVRNLAALSPLPVAWWDERLSTAAAERVLIEADAPRRRRAEVIDKMAAAYILQGALDRISSVKRNQALSSIGD